MKKVLFILFLIPGAALAQKIPDSGFDKVRVVLDDKIIQADLTPVEKEPHADPARQYYWYSANKIQITQGGFSGRLLNGVYTEYFLNKNLKEQGEFTKGLKDGVWKIWADNGTLIELTTWKKGVKNGPFTLFDEHGALKQKGGYNSNLLDGRVTNYVSKDSTSTLLYRKGTLVPQKTRKSFIKKINPFTKKKKTDTAAETKKPLN